MNRPILALFTLCTIAVIELCTATVYDVIRADMINNFPAIKMNQHIAPQGKKEIAFPAVTLSDYEKHEALFSLLNTGTSSTNEGILDTQTIGDLGLFFYNAQRPDYTVLEKIYRGFSINGKVAQAVLIAEPTTHVPTLHSRQILIQYLRHNQTLQKKLVPLFQELASLEEQLYSLWNTDDILYTNYVKKTFYNGSFTKYRGAHGAAWLEFSRRKKDFKPIIDFLVLDTINTVIRTLHIKYTHGEHNASARPGWLKAFTSEKEKPLSQIQKRAKYEENVYAAASTVISLLPAFIEFDQWKQSMRSYKNLVTHIRQRVKALITCRTIIQNIHSCIEDDPVIQRHLPHYNAIKHFTQGADTNQREFLHTLSDPAFHSDSYHFSYIGKVLHAIPQFLELKHSFSAVFAGIGALECFLSCAFLINEKELSPTPWCFPEYCQNTTPYLTITDYYHPLIPSDDAVLNSIVLEQNNGQGMLVTGPNASGKSMNVRSIALCVTLGQSLGIAPAQKAIITPLSKILTYLNPIDNIAQGRSLFQVEEDRISTIVRTAYLLPLDQFSLIIVDELLSSTAPIEGEAATFGICYGLSKLTNCVPIAATHFARLTTLPQHTNDFFRNYHVSVIREENGDITHTFKLEYGRSHQVIAIDLARKAGFDSDILARAEEFLHIRGIKRTRTAL